MPCRLSLDSCRQLQSGSQQLHAPAADTLHHGRPHAPGQGELHKCQTNLYLTMTARHAQVISRGMRNRKVGSHELNMESSRSHSIVTVYCDTPAGEEVDACARYGKVSLCYFPLTLLGQLTAPTAAQISRPPCIFCSDPWPLPPGADGGLLSKMAGRSQSRGPHHLLTCMRQPAAQLRLMPVQPRSISELSATDGLKSEGSARPHIILNTNEQKFWDTAQVSFVDLAGSERVKDTKASGEMLKETSSINRSLFTLGKVHLHS